MSITKRHFPDMQHLGDVTQLHGSEIPPVDIISFGSPCQNFSTIGNKAGIAGASSSLFFHAVRIINEMKEATNGEYPTIAIWENVVGALISNSGFDYAAVLEALSGAEIPMPDTGKWARSGMVVGGRAEIAWRVMDSQHFRNPQRRNRIFLLADFRGKRTAKILFNPAHLHEILEDGRIGKYSYAESDRESLSEAGRHPPEVYAIQDRSLRGAVQEKHTKGFIRSLGAPDRPCPTLLASEAQRIAVHYPDNPEKDHIRHITPLEAERLMGLPDGWTKHGHDGKIISDSARYKALGNAIVLPCAEYIMSGISHFVSL